MHACKCVVNFWGARQAIIAWNAYSGHKSCSGKCFSCYLAKNFIYDFTNTFSLQQHHTGQKSHLGGHCFLSLLFKSANCMYVKMYACMYGGVPQTLIKKQIKEIS